MKIYNTEDIIKLAKEMIIKEFRGANKKMEWPLITYLAKKKEKELENMKNEDLMKLMKKYNLYIFENFNNWKKPDFDNEIDEFERVSEEFKLDIEDLRRSFYKGEVVDINRLDREVENTDYYEANDVTEFIDKCIKEYGKNVEGIRNILNGFKSNQLIEMPIILSYNNINHLVSGNTRLTLSKLLDIRNIKVYIFKHTNVKRDLTLFDSFSYKLQKEEFIESKVNKFKGL